MARSSSWTSTFVYIITSLISCGASAGLPSYPLAVRNPFLSAWIPGDQSHSLPHTEAQFWTGQPLGWTISARLDNKTYSLLGNTSHYLSAVQTSINYTSTHTIVELEAGSVDFILDFFSPISPKNYIRQSIPFSYFTVSAESKNGSAHTVEIMSAIDSQWTGENIDEPDFGFQNSATSAMINMSIPNYEIYTVKSDMAAWGHVILAAEQSNDSIATLQTGNASTIYSAFLNNGKLSMKQGKGNIAATAKGLGKVVSKTSATFAIGRILSD